MRSTPVADPGAQRILAMGQRLLAVHERDGNKVEADRLRVALRDFELSVSWTERNAKRP